MPNAPVMAFSIAMALVGAGCTASTTAEATIVDDAGHPVRVDDTSRIVVTSVDLAEVLIQFGHAERLVGVPAWIESERTCVQAPAGLPDAATRLGVPHVLNAEEIIALDPSLVLVKDHPLQPTPLAEQLRRAHVPTFEFRNDETLENVHHTYTRVAQILATTAPGVHERAADAWGEFGATINATQNAIQGVDGSPRALFQFPAGLVAGAGTSADVLLQLAGATNMARDLGLEGYKQLSNEALAAGDPQRVVASCTAAASPDVFFNAPKYESTTAARYAPQSLRVVDPSTSALVGPRFAQGVQSIAQWLHPGAFGLIDAHVTMQPTGHDFEVTITIANATAQAPPLAFRLDPGDGRSPWILETTHETYAYAGPGAYEATLHLVDAQDRIHELRFTVEVTQ